MYNNIYICHFNNITTIKIFLSGSFFHWLNKPHCADCGTETEHKGGAHPTDEERLWLAGMVEVYRCPNCGKDERFPRYNHPQKLLGNIIYVLEIRQY